MADKVTSGSWYNTQVTLTCSRCGAKYKFRCNELEAKELMMVNDRTGDLVTHGWRVSVTCQECGKVDRYKADSYPSTSLNFIT